MVLLDLSAAFDTVDHDALLDVIQKRFGVECCALDWFLVIPVKPDTIVLRYIRAVGSCQFAMQCSARLQNRSARVYRVHGGYRRNNSSFSAKPPSLRRRHAAPKDLTYCGHKHNPCECVKLKTGPHQDGCSSMLTRPS